jgi:hypothetical protein
MNILFSYSIRRMPPKILTPMSLVPPNRHANSFDHGMALPGKYSALPVDEPNE